MILGTIGGFLAFAGGGKSALDAALGWELSGHSWGIAGVGAGVIAGIGAQLSRRRALAPATA